MLNSCTWTIWNSWDLTSLLKFDSCFLIFITTCLHVEFQGVFPGLLKLSSCILIFIATFLLGHFLNGWRLISLLELDSCILIFISACLLVEIPKGIAVYYPLVLDNYIVKFRMDPNHIGCPWDQSRTQLMKCYWHHFDALAISWISWMYPSSWNLGWIWWRMFVIFFDWCRGIVMTWFACCFKYHWTWSRLHH